MLNKRVNRKSLTLGWITGTFLLSLMVNLPAQAEDQQSIAALRNIGKAFASIAEKASPAVVSVQAEKELTGRSSGQGQEYQMPFNEDMFEWFFGPRNRMPQQDRQRPKRTETVQGTGFFVSQDGYILTNNHLVGTDKNEEVTSITVTLSTGEELKAKVIGTDPDTDVAVIKIEGEGHKYIELADSDALEVGEWVIAIGNPFGLSHTVTAGIVSAKGRNVALNNYDNFIQTDAAINRGNSGGPLLNLDGKAVGINSAIFGPMGNIGIGLAIPINMAKNVYEQLVATGEVTRGFLGVLPADVDHATARRLKLDEVRGALVDEVTADSAADKAGIKAYDVVTEFNGESVKDAQDFRLKVAQVKPGEKVDLVVVRKGHKKTLTATLDRRPDSETAKASEQEKGADLGIEVHNLTEELASRYDYEGMEGVIITGVEPGSDAERKGLQPGLLIIEADFEPVKNAKQFQEIVKAAKDEGEIILRVYTGQFKRIVTVKFND
jgi:serine protease Do